MKKLLSDKKLVLLVSGLFICIFTTSFLAYMISFFSKNNSKTLFVLITFVVVLTAVSYFILILLLRSYSKKINTFLITTSLVFISAVILTILLKIVSSINESSFLIKTGFISVIILFVYYASLIGISFLPISKSKKGKVFQEKKI